MAGIMAKQLRNTGLPAAVLLLDTGLGMFVAKRQQQSDTVTEGLLRPNPKTPAPFTAVDHQHRPFARDDLLGKWAFLSFGYTHCLGERPTTPAIMNQAGGRLAEAAEVQTVFVSANPKRDTPVRLAQYLAGFNPGFIGVGGSAKQAAQLARQIGAAYQLDEDGDVKGRFHSTSLFLIAPRGRFAALFPMPHDAARIVQRLRRIQRFVNA